MDDRALLLLGILRTQSLHGYQLNDFIGKNLSRVIEMKKATAYAILDRLHESGYILVHLEQKGNRPPRQVYTITPKGEEHFLALLRDNLSKADRTSFAGDIGLMFFDQLSKEETVNLLKHRLSELQVDLAMYEQAAKNGMHTPGITLAIEHTLALLQADHDWLSKLIGRFENESLLNSF